MGEIPKQLWAWLARMLPKQQNEGAGAVQVGKVGGDVVSNVTIVNISHSQFSNTQSGSIATVQQREVLGMIRGLRNNESVFMFMEKHFGTRMVIDLQPSQLVRVKRYVEAINRRMKREVT